MTEFACIIDDAHETLWGWCPDLDDEQMWLQEQAEERMRERIAKENAEWERRCQEGLPDIPLEVE